MLNAARRLYRRDGFVLLRPLFARPEADLWRREADRLDTGLALLEPVMDSSPVFSALAADPRVCAAAAAVLDQPARLISGKLVFHHPGAHGLDIHQDYVAWRYSAVPADALISVLVAIDASSEANGAMEFYPGLHQHWQADTPRPDPAGAEPRLIALEPGDALLFHSLAPHRTGPNRTARPRRALCFTFAASSTRS